MTPALAFVSTDTKTLRAKHRAERRRLQAVQNVSERLSVFSLYPTAKQADPQFLMQNASAIVSAVVALILAPEV